MTAQYRALTQSYHPSTKAHPASGAAKPRVLAALRDAARYSPPDATKDPTTAELSNRLAKPGNLLTRRVHLMFRRSAFVALVLFSLATPIVLSAQSFPYTEGSVWTMNMLRVRSGHFDDYYNDLRAMLCTPFREAVWANT